MKREYISNTEQLDRWVSGESVHRLMTTGGDECCPDFSCCYPSLQAEESIRKSFAAADEKQRMSFLGHFLGAALSVLTKKDVAIVGSGTPEDQS